MFNIADLVECLAEELAAIGSTLSTSKTQILTTKDLNEPMFLHIGGDMIESSRVEPVRQKMAGPIGHRREKEKKREQIAKYIHEI